MNKEVNNLSENLNPLTELFNYHPPFIPEIDTLTEEEKESLSALNYPTRPFLYDAKTGLEISGNQNERITPKSTRTHSMLSPTIYGLSEALVNAENGSGLRELLDEEMSRYFSQADENGIAPDYGIWAHYPRENMVVQFPPPYLHKIGSIASNSRLLLDPEMNLGFNEARKIFSKLTPAIIGLSVGSNITKALVQTFRPDNILVADPALYKLTNINRVTNLSAWQMTMTQEEMQSSYNLLGLRNKSQILAEQLHSVDPFINIFAFMQGVTELNLPNFLGGNRIQPKASFAIEVCDNLTIKLEAAEESRRQGIRHIRISDVGDQIFIDIRPFDIDPNTTIAPGISDEKLHELYDIYTQQSSEQNFFALASALVGPEHLKNNTEFGKLINHEIDRTVASVPQLGATTMAGGGIASLLVARMLLGYEHYHERMIFDMKNFQTSKQYSPIPAMKLPI